MKQVYVSMVEVDNYVRVWTVSAVRQLVTADRGIAGNALRFDTALFITQKRRRHFLVTIFDEALAIVHVDSHTARRIGDVVRTAPIHPQPGHDQQTHQPGHEPVGFAAGDAGLYRLRFFLWKPDEHRISGTAQTGHVRQIGLYRCYQDMLIVEIHSDTDVLQRHLGECVNAAVVARLLPVVMAHESVGAGQQSGVDAHTVALAACFALDKVPAVALANELESGTTDGAKPVVTSDGNDVEAVHFAVLSEGTTVVVRVNLNHEISLKEAPGAIEMTIQCFVKAGSTDYLYLRVRAPETKIKLPPSAPYKAGTPPIR